MATKMMKIFLWLASVMIATVTIIVLFILPFKPVPEFGIKADTSKNDSNLWNQFTEYITAAMTVPTVAEITDPSMNYVGVYTPGGIQDVQNFDAEVAATTNMVMFFKNWHQHQAFDDTEYMKAYELGKIPVISWEPWNPKGDSKDQPEYSLDSIINGNHDGYIRSWARGIHDMKIPVGIRFAHEMNGYWYPWSVNAVGGSAEKYVAAWKHVHDIFKEEKADNVAWIWSPNVNRYLADIPLAPIYPGDEYVDIVATVGYGTFLGETANDTFGSTVDEIRTFTNKPMIISETGAEEFGDMNKAAWISTLFTFIEERPNMIGFIWFNEKKRGDWRVNSGDAAREAFHNGTVNYLANTKSFKPKQLPPK